MDTLGKQWATQVPPVWDENDEGGRAVFMLAQQRLERQARELFTEWQSSIVPTGIKNSMERNQPHTGFQTQAWLLTTRAFRDFQDWLVTQELICSCCYPQDDDPDLLEKGENVILILMPRQSAPGEPLHH